MGSAVDNSGAERHRTKAPSNRKDETSAAPGGLSHALDPVETSFTSLIQQYLGLLQYDNATFLAERLVAHKSSPHAIYLLAMCYYRKGSPKSARSVLLNLSRSRFRASSTNNKKHNITKDDLMEDNILYLLSKCCLDLSLYAEAEEVILRRARFQYTSAKKNGTNSSKETFEEWLSRTNQTETYQIPNGAVGLGLLGDICRKTRRRDKAALFYRMSLQVSFIHIFRSRSGAVLVIYCSLKYFCRSSICNQSLIRYCGRVMKHFAKWAYHLLIWTLPKSLELYQKHC